MTLFERLDEYAGSGAQAMHMPGHKRNTAAFPWLAGLAERDITEIHGFDNLNDPEGLFARLEERMAALWGADVSIPLVNGSTVGILASVLACLEGGGELLMARDSHKSVYNAAVLSRAGTRYLNPRLHPVFGFPLSVTPEEVEAALDAGPGVKLVCVTSPTYQGVISDIASIAAVCHRRGVPLLVDEAHGAHLGFGGFPGSAVAQGADLVVQSLHKTLPSLTQTAVLHIRRGLVDPGPVRRCTAMLQSSSPSYLLSASIDACVDFLEREGQEAAHRWLEALLAARRELSGLERLSLWDGGDGVFRYDPSKLLVGGPGLWLERKLRDTYRIEPEYALLRHVLAMTGMGDTRESLGRLTRALRELDRQAPEAPEAPLPAAAPAYVLPLGQALASPGRAVPADRAAGRVSGEFVWSYPPGIPLLVPGQRITGETLAQLGLSPNLHSTYNGAPNSIFCVDLPGKIV